MSCSIKLTPMLLYSYWLVLMITMVIRVEPMDSSFTCYTAFITHISLCVIIRGIHCAYTLSIYANRITSSIIDYKECVK